MTGGPLYAGRRQVTLLFAKRRMCIAWMLLLSVNCHKSACTSLEYTQVLRRNFRRKRNAMLKRVYMFCINIIHMMKMRRCSIGLICDYKRPNWIMTYHTRNYISYTYINTHSLDGNSEIPLSQNIRVGIFNWNKCLFFRSTHFDTHLIQSLHSIFTPNHMHTYWAILHVLNDEKSIE